MILAFRQKNVGPEKVVRNLSGSLYMKTPDSVLLSLFMKLMESATILTLPRSRILQYFANQ